MTDRDQRLTFVILWLFALFNYIYGDIGMIFSLFVSPEHNRSMSAALKNVIDWGTRPYGTSVWLDKPGAVIGTSSGAVGTAAAQSHLRSVLTSLGIALMGRPEAYVVFKDTLMDGSDTVTDEALRKQLAFYVDAFSGWIARVSSQRA